MEKIIKQSKEEEKKKKGKKPFLSNKKSILIGVGVIIILLVIFKFIAGSKTSIQVQSGIKPKEVEKSVEEVVKPIYNQQKEIKEQQKRLLSSFKQLNETLKILNNNIKENKKSYRSVTKNVKRQTRQNEEKALGIIPKEIISGNTQGTVMGTVIKEQEVEKEIRLNHLANYEINKKRGFVSQIQEQGKTKVKKKKKTAYIPAGSVVEGRLLYGFVAPSKGMLPPVLVEFTKPIRTANDFYIPAQKCLITTSAQYNISQGLAILGGLKSKLSCVLKNGHIIEIPVNIAVGEEKRNGLVQIGLTGKEQWLTAEDFAKISSMGTITGISSGMQQGLIQQSITPQGNIITAIKDRGLYAVLSGVNQGTSKFFDFWMKKYEAKVPAIVVEPKQKVFVVFVNGANLGISDKELKL